jgi:3',5'-cyclic AMP phosphodiesterase CpdA
MIETSYKPTDRRGFLKKSLIAVGVAIAVSSAFGFDWFKDEIEVTNWAFLADTHITQDTNDNYRGFYPCQNLQKVIPDIVSCSPDGIIIAGDLAQMEGNLVDYENLKRMLGPIPEKMPVYMALGNHDNRLNFPRVFDKIPGEQQAVRDKLVVVVSRPPVRLIILDSLLYTNIVPGLLGKAQRQWLESYLKECDNTPTILCFHHTLGDNDSDLLDTAGLFRIIESDRKIKAVIYGHSHRYRFDTFKGIHLINIPAVGYNFTDAEPVGWVQTRLTAKGGDFTLHTIGGNRRADGNVKKLTWR